MDPFSFSLEETFVIPFKSNAMKSLKSFRLIQPLGEFIFSILLLLKKGFR